MARQRGDAKLEDFVTSPIGLARIQALAELTGGSPRIWMILADCLDPDSLDSLIPAVQDLLEGLVPYYQQLLWERAPNEQRIIRALAEGDKAALTVSEISEASELAPAVTSVALKRLVASRWVEAAKSKTGDRRRTWYQLRDPLLRHHFQYRSGDRRPLTLIVTFLKVIYDPAERREHLLRAARESPAVAHLAATFQGAPRRSDNAYAGRDVDALQSEARLWRSEDDGPWSRSRVGALLDDLVDRARSESASGHADLEDVVGTNLKLAVRRLQGRDRHIAAIVEACWNGEGQAEAARNSLHQVVNGLATDDPMRLLAREEYAYWTGRAGDHAAARDLLTEIVIERTRTLGPRHFDTLTTRRNHAYNTGEEGDPATARDLFAELLVDQTNTLGPNDPDTLRARHNHAQNTARAGDLATARDLFADLIVDQTRTLGHRHSDTLTTRHSHAHWTGIAGDAATARDLFANLVVDQTRTLGLHHPDTLTTRHSHAYYTAQTVNALLRWI